MATRTKAATTTTTPPIKTGECYWRDEAGDLWLATSWLDEATGETFTTNSRDGEEASANQPDGATLDTEG